MPRTSNRCSPIRDFLFFVLCVYNTNLYNFPSTRFIGPIRFSIGNNKERVSTGKRESRGGRQRQLLKSEAEGKAA
jgi:hypothetical protein